MTDVLLDTSVAVPLLLTSHSAHQNVREELANRTVALAGHAFSETYAVLTRLPGDARLAPTDAVRLLRESLGEPAILDARTYRAAPAILAKAGISGGATYDGLIALAARSAGLPLLSRDRRALSTYRLLDVPVELLA